MYALLVVNIELFILGVGLCITTLIYVKMQTRVFQGDFAEEQKFFIWSMASLLIVYIMRFANMMAIDMWQDQYLAWMRKYPASFITTTTVFHIFYDAFPVVHIMLRHRKTFARESQQMTDVVMNLASSHDTFAGQLPPGVDELKWRSSVTNIE